jgi:5-methylcytosine-specific restriction endonuclease McrA
MAKVKFAPHPAVRKDRIRPRAKLAPMAPPPVKPASNEPPYTFWNCRPSGKRHRYEGGVDKRLRMSMTKEEALAFKAMLVELQDNMCALCGDYLTMDEMDDPVFRPSIDHVYPRFSGGQDEGNVVAAHNHCNGDKTNDLPTGCELIWLYNVTARLAMRAAANAKPRYKYFGHGFEMRRPDGWRLMVFFDAYPSPEAAWDYALEWYRR